MLGLGIGEIVLIAALILVVVGPERLPHLMRKAGRMYGQVRRAADELRRAFVLEADRMDAEDRYRDLQKRRQDALDARKKALESTGGDTVAQDRGPARGGGPEPSPDPTAAEQSPTPDAPQATDDQASNAEAGPDEASPRRSLLPPPGPATRPRTPAAPPAGDQGSGGEPEPGEGAAS